MAESLAAAGDHPLVGVGLPVLGPHASPTNIERLARTADRLGFSSISLSERLLLPAGPQWRNDFGLPDWPAFDSIETLTWIASKTERIRLRTDVIIPVFQQPVVLARRLATLDHLSGGRIDIGVALGWLPEEFEAVGVAPNGRAARFEECLAALRACWAPDPVEFSGRYYRIPRAKIGPKPRRGTIPLTIGALARPAVERAARLGDGLTIGFRNWDATREQINWYRDAGGSGPIIVRGGPMLTDAEHQTPPTTWMESHIIDSLAELTAEGVAEFIWDLNIVGYEPARQLELFSWLADALGLEASTTIADS